ncbi:DUF4861 family protein [Galbibacter sp.]|jgi:hypothetical protein|uniref:DUF4861 family protein n=1 Tax=Galbibacter sp. TaxID=2918471 RepID=UPI003A8EEE68
MKTIQFLIPVCCLTLCLSCKQQEKKQTTSKDTIEKVAETPKSSGLSYAEISVKEGGKWVNRKYEGGGAFKNVTHLDVPKEHTDHSYYIRYEGPGWETDKVGYRLYLDWRNAIDIFGKKTHEKVLPQVGQDNFDSYHEMSNWGMDILKAGKSLGIGSIGRYSDGKVLHFENVEATMASVDNSDQKSTVEVNYTGWETAGDKIDLKSELTIKPGDRYTKHTVTASKAISGLSTGIVKFDAIKLIQKTSANGKWAYIASYGEQTLVPDKLGMALFYNTASVNEVVNGSDDHLVVFNPSTEAISFYFLGAWEKEKDGIKNQQEFLSYINGLLKELNSNNQLP